MYSHISKYNTNRSVRNGLGWTRFFKIFIIHSFSQYSCNAEYLQSTELGLVGTHFLPVGSHFTTLPGPHHLWTSSVLLTYIQFSLFSTRNTELQLNGSTGLVLADTTLVTSGSVPMTRARPSSFLPNAAVILQVHGRAHLHQSGSLRDLDEQDPPADHAGHTAWERKTLSLATKMWGLLVTAE